MAYCWVYNLKEKKLIHTLLDRVHDLCYHEALTKKLARASAWVSWRTMLAVASLGPSLYRMDIISMMVMYAHNGKYNLT